MASSNKTIFQRLTDLIIGTGNVSPTATSSNVNYNLRGDGNRVLYSFDSKEERDKKLLQIKQQRLMAHQWVKAGYDTAMTQMGAENLLLIMYRDCDLMDQWPEIGAALDIYAEEATTTKTPKNPNVINVHSKSPRVVSVLNDLFNNRLDANVIVEMIARSLCKYGNEFMLLNISDRNGVEGWRELPVHQMRRLEGGLFNVYNGCTYSSLAETLKHGEVKFVWEGMNMAQPYENWQIAHFRLIKDSIYLPYGSSILNKARRAWKMLSMMEDAMLLYRLERSIERRMFKVNVGLIDDKDVPGFLQEFMSNVKRAPIIDPMTGMMDLKRNFLDVSADYVIPIRNGQDPTTIETLQSAQNQTSLEDIEYMEKKVLAALRVPKSYLNFDEPQGKGQNLSLLDIRFARAVNSVQKAILMELTKVAIVHLYILGFHDDISNFTLTMESPSNQLEQMVLDNMAKRLQNATTALAEQGGGLPLMSWRRVERDIMGYTDAEIDEMLIEMRVEKALATELQLTSQAIKKTGLFKKADAIYGDPNVEYDYSQGEEGGGGLGGGGGLPPSGGFGDTLGDIGGPMGEDMGDIGGEESEVPLEGGGAQLFEANEKEEPQMLDKAFRINETINSMLSGLDKFSTKEKEIL